MKYISYKDMKDFYTIDEVCRLFEMDKAALRHYAEKYDISPQEDQYGNWGFRKVLVRKLHNHIYKEQRSRPHGDKDAPWDSKPYKPDKSPWGNKCCTRIYIDDDEGDDAHVLCRACRERFYTHCERCGALITNDSIYQYGGEDLCRDCYDDRCESGPIHEYSYMPELVFHGKGLRRFGVELEIDEGGESTAHARHFLDIANCHSENLYIKTDGSLDDGLELVTHPMTLDYHLNDMPWKDILDEAKRLGYRSHGAGTCGLHVHISRMAFGCTYDTQESCIARLVYFVEKFWPELLRFSRRTQAQLNRWAARYGMKLCPREQLNHAKDSCAGRYTAVNLTNADTIELRLFRGTLKYNTLIATLQLVNHLCEVAISLSDTELQDMSWFDFLDRIDEPELIQYLKERRLYVNEPVTTETEEGC